MAAKLAYVGIFAGLALHGLAQDQRQSPTPERKLATIGIWPNTCGSVSCCEQASTGAIYICPDTRAVPSQVYTSQQCTDLGAIVACPGAQPTKIVPADLNPTIPPGEVHLFISAYAGSVSTVYACMFVEMLLMLCFACIYNMNAVEPVIQKKGTIADRKHRPREADDFAVNICECFSDIWVCLHGCFCPLARMGHTNAVSGVLGFWETVCIWFCCSVFIPMGPCCLTVFFRMQLKKIMNVRDNIFNDCCVACFCPYLAICQQGTAVDRAMGYEVTGCCDLEWQDDRDGLDDYE